MALPRTVASHDYRFDYVQFKRLGSREATLEAGNSYIDDNAATVVLWEPMLDAFEVFDDLVGGLRCDCGNAGATGIEVQWQIRKRSKSKRAL